MDAGWYEILLNLDIDTIDNIYYINKLSYNLCKDKRFWIDKFTHDSLPIINIQNTIPSWIKEYKNIQKAKIKLYNEVETILYVLDIYEIALDEFNTSSDIPFLPNKIVNELKIMEINESKPRVLTLFAIACEQKKLKYKFSHNEINKDITIIVTIDDLNDLFLNIYYYEHTTGKKLNIFCV